MFMILNKVMLIYSVVTLNKTMNMLMASFRPLQVRVHLRAQDL